MGGERVGHEVAGDEVDAVEESGGGEAGLGHGDDVGEVKDGGGGFGAGAEEGGAAVSVEEGESSGRGAAGAGGGGITTVVATWDGDASDGPTAFEEAVVVDGADAWS